MPVNNNMILTWSKPVKQEPVSQEQDPVLILQSKDLISFVYNS